MEFGEDFLNRPELFPARCAGELRGDGEVVLALAGELYELSGLDGDQVRTLRGRFEGWVRRVPARADERVTGIRVYRAPGEEFRDPGTAWREYRLDLDYRQDAVRVAGFHLMAVLAPGPSVSAALWTSKKGAAFAGLAENVLRLVAAYRLLESRKVLLHSAALVRGGEAVLFPGRSGAGKSTLCRLGLAAGWEVLSDELNVLGLDDDGLAVEQVPFTGDLDPGRTARPTRARFPLRGICLPEKAAADGLKPISAGRALGALLSTAPYVNRDPHRGERLAGLLEAAVRHGPASVLGFTRTSGLEVLGELAPAGARVDAA